MAHIIRAEGSEVRQITPKNGTDFSGEEINKIVGGSFERVQLDLTHDMWLNQEGKLLSLDINVGATTLFNLSFPWANDVIHGDVLICHPNEVK